MCPGVLASGLSPEPKMQGSCEAGRRWCQVGGPSAHGHASLSVVP